MNEHVRPKRREPTQAAEGLPRWRWTLEEFERFIELGIFSEGDRVELIGGEIVPMSPKGIFHETMRVKLQVWLWENLSDGFVALTEPGWRPDARQYFEPDCLILPKASASPTAPARDVSLLIEISKTSLDYDLQLKSGAYARLGVREYWVIEAQSRLTHVHRDPGDEDYGTKTKVSPDQALLPHLLPDLSVSIDEIMGQ